MRILIFTCFVSILLLVTPNIVFANRINPNDSLKVEVKIISKSYCLDKSPLLVEDSKIQKLKEIPYVSTIQDLEFKIELTNIGSKPLIVQKDFFAIPQIYVAKSVELFNKDKFIRDIRGFISPQFNTIEDESPQSDKFVILDSGKTFTKMISLSVDLDEKPKMKNGNYYLGLVLYIWGGQNWADEKVRGRWGKFGYLWTEPVFVKPLLLTVKKPKIIEECIE